MEKYIAELAKQAEQLNSIRAILQFGVFTSKYDENFTILTMDEYFCEMLGYTQDELMEECRGKAGELIYQEDYKSTVSEIFRQCTTASEFSCQYRVRKKDGTLLWVWDSGVKKEDKNGGLIIQRVIANINDLVNLRKERDTAYENIPGGVAYIDIYENDFTIRDGNENFFEMLGVDKKEYLIENIRYTDKDDLPRLREHFSKQAKVLEPIDIEFRAKVPKGNITKWFQVMGRFYAQELDCVEYLCIMTDVTERRKMIALLNQEKERYQIAMKSTADIVYEYDVNTDELTVYPGRIENPSSLLAKGGTYKNWRELLLRDNIIYPEDQKKILEIASTKDHYQTELRLLKTNVITGEKEYQWYKVNAAGAFDDKNHLIKVVGVLQDIEERKEQDKLLGELNPILISQLSKSYERIFIVDLRKGTYELYASKKRGDFYSIEKQGNHEERTLMMVDKFVYKEDKERYLFSLRLERMVELLNTGEEEVSRFFRILDTTGEYRWKCYRYSYYNMDMNKILVSVHDIHDIRMEEQKTEETTRRILINALQEAKKANEARVNFITMMTDEIREPLQSMLQMSKMSAEDVRNENKVKKFLEHVNEASSYMLKIAGELTEISCLDKGVIQFGRETINLYQLITAVLKEQKKVANENQVKIIDNIQILPEKRYLGDEFRVRQVIGNILANSVRFSPKGETVKIQVSEREGQAGMMNVVISIEDMGVHVNEDFFERLYSEDKRSLFSQGGNIIENTGFSLILCKDIVELMGGRIEVTNGNRGENYFQIELPLEPVRKRQDMTEILKGNQEYDKTQIVDLGPYSILLVQNKRKRNPLLSALLKINGAKVEVAYSATEAMAVWEIYTGGGFQAILTDAVLEDMDALEFAETIRNSSHPDAKTVPILLMSDNVITEDMKRSYQKGINGTISKPINMQRLIQTLQAVNGGLIK